DPFIPFDQLKIELDNLSVLVEDNRASEIKDMLHRLVPSYKSNSKIVDLYYEESLKNKNDLKKSTKVKDQENKVVRIKT
ncbi:hypothetical protein, partial [Klebsiella pneumoniae]